MLRYTTVGARPGLVALYDIQPGNGVGRFLQPRSPHGAYLWSETKLEDSGELGLSKSMECDIFASVFGR